MKAVENNKLSIKRELPSEYADRLGLEYTEQVGEEHKKDNGQYFTSVRIAQYMASLSTTEKNDLYILDPGFGTGTLTCALVEHLVYNHQSNSIHLIAYETDPFIIPFSIRVLDNLRDWLRSKDVQIEYLLHTTDYILENATILKNKNTPLQKFDIVISNPPYFKLTNDDERVKSVKEVLGAHTNIYSMFMAMAAKLLFNGGELIFITPRSFASGSYFKAFREFLFSIVQIDRIHLFNSRTDAFTRDKILQELLIIHAKKQLIERTTNVSITSSNGISDINEPIQKNFLFEELVDLNTKEKILHLPTNDKEECVLNLIATWKHRLIDYDIRISTGPVVAFRLTDYLQSTYENGNVKLVPLFWLQNVYKMNLIWPQESDKREQYIRLEKQTKTTLIPNKNYIFLRRFSTKDDQSRLIAAPYFCNYNKSDLIGVENKLNYIYRFNGHLDRNEAVGLCALLNSELFDTYFQIFNGNVNVSATELREMKFPPLEYTKELGNKIIISNDYSMDNVNFLINSYFELESVLI